MHFCENDEDYRDYDCYIAAAIIKFEPSYPCLDISRRGSCSPILVLKDRIPESLMDHVRVNHIFT